MCPIQAKMVPRRANASAEGKHIYLYKFRHSAGKRKLFWGERQKGKLDNLFQNLNNNNNNRTIRNFRYSRGKISLQFVAFFFAFLVKFN